MVSTKRNATKAKVTVDHHIQRAPVQLDPKTITGSPEMQAMAAELQMSLYTRDSDGIITCPGSERMCMDDVIEVLEVLPDQHKVIRDHLEKALRSARRKWVREMRKAVRRSMRDLQTDKQLISGFVAREDGLFLVLQHHKESPVDNGAHRMAR